MSERRVSKRLKAKAITPVEDNNDEGYSPPGPAETVSDFEDEPATPARKVMNSVSSRPSSKGKRKGKLSQLPDMPLDILFQIFSYLHPRDLISITRTNKLCRDTLLAPSAVSIWKAARRPYEAPDPLSDFTEPRWAKFLFGGAFCEICGKTGIKDPDFFLRRRVCKSCLAQKCVDDENERLPHYADVLHLVPFTRVRKGRGRSGRGVRCWWRTDLEEVAARYRPLVFAHKRGEPGTEDNLASYKRERLEHVRSVNMQALICEDWLRQHRHALWEEKLQQQSNRRDAIENKFVELGYDKADISLALIKREAAAGGPLTDRIWTRIRPKLEAAVQDARQQRLRREKLAAMTSVVNSLYKTYLKTTVPPKEWRHHPCASEICRFPEFIDVFEATDGDITEETFASLIPRLPSMIQSWKPRQRARVLERLATPGRALHACACPSCPLCTNPNDSSLNLASAVFECTYCIPWQLRNVFFYPDGHHCIGHGKCGDSIVPILSRGLHYTATSVIRKAGLDPKNATVDDMDQHLFLRDPHSTDRVYTWRQMVLYLGRSYPPRDDLVTVLSPEQKANVIYVEDASIRQSWWTCTHCAEHFDNWKTHEEVAAHVKEVHGIEKPATEVDIILGPDNSPCSDHIGALPPDLSWLHT